MSAKVHLSWREVIYNNYYDIIDRMTIFVFNEVKNYEKHSKFKFFLYFSNFHIKNPKMKWIIFKEEEK